MKSGNYKIRAFLLLVSAIMLVVGMVGGMPRVYYQLSRWVICGTCVFNMIYLIREGKYIISFFLGTKGFLFATDGLFRISRDTGKAIVILTIGIFAYLTVCLAVKICLECPHLRKLYINIGGFILAIGLYLLALRIIAAIL